jgi:hypothetical protein
MFIPQQPRNNNLSMSYMMECGQDESVFKNHVVNTIQSNFTDLMLHVDNLLLPAVDNVLRRPPHSLHINPKQLLLSNGINKMHFSESKEQKKILDTVRIALGCCYVLLHEQRLYEKLGHQEFSRQYELSEEMFLAKYQQDIKFREVFRYSPNSGQISNLDRKDLKYMTQFCKYTRLVLELLPGYRNKGLAIQIAGRLEGSKEVYVFGSGQRDTATRREVIYHMESGTPFPVKGMKENGDARKVNSRRSKTSTDTVKEMDCHVTNNKRSRSLSFEFESDPSLDNNDCSSIGDDSCRQPSKIAAPGSGFDQGAALYLDDYGLAVQCPPVSTQTTTAVVPEMAMAVDFDFDHLDDMMMFNIDDIDLSSLDDILNITNPSIFYPM